MNKFAEFIKKLLIKTPKFVLKKMEFVLFNIIHKYYIKSNGLSEDLKIFTHMTIPERLAIHGAVKSFIRDVVYVEIGSYIGASAVMAASGSKKGSRIYCIDTWQNNAMLYAPEDIDSSERDTFDEFSKNTSKYTNKIIPLRGWSYDVHSILKDSVPVVDFLFIDGDHSYEGVLKDWVLYSPLLKTGSLVAFHDSGWAEGVKKVIEQEVSSTKFQLYKELPNMKIFKVL